MKLNGPDRERKLHITTMNGNDYLLTEREKYEGFTRRTVWKEERVYITRSEMAKLLAFVATTEKRTK